MQIIQIISHQNLLLGLSDEGLVYYWNTSGNNWVEYKG